MVTLNAREAREHSLVTCHGEAEMGWPTSWELWLQEEISKLAREVITNPSLCKVGTSDRLLLLQLWWVRDQNPDPFCYDVMCDAASARSKSER